MLDDQSNNGAPVESIGAGAEPQQPTLEEAAEGTRRRIRRLPPEVGAVLMTVGVAGIVLPGPIGTPLLLAGGLVLMPGVFDRLERWVGKRYPKLHGHGMKYVDRFIDDFERRYPPEESVESADAVRR